MATRGQIATDRLEVEVSSPTRNRVGPQHRQADGREQVADIQRARMLAAMIEEVAEHCVGSITVSDVVTRSGVSRRTFYEIFEDREDCFLAALDTTIEKLANVVVPAYEQKGTWQAKIRAALTALLEYLDHEPRAGRLVIVETLGAGHKALERRRRSIAQILTIVDQGRQEGKTGASAPPLAAEGIVGGVLSVLHGRLTQPEPGSLVELVNPLTSMIVLPYLGAAAARKEIERPTPKPQPKRQADRRDPLQGLDMRLTYRTVRVLMAMAARPGSSNRAVADGADIADQGQISKLLNRLHGLGLIDNAGGAPAQGEPNAWTLTARGWEVHAAIAAQTPTA
jgi:AcrR family transcriptional regulator